MSAPLFDHFFSGVLITHAWRDKFVNELRGRTDGKDVLDQIETSITLRNRNKIRESNGYSKLAFIYMGLGNYRKAKELFEKDITLGLATWWMRLRYSECLLLSGFSVESENLIHAIYSHFPDARNGFASLATVYISRGEFEYAFQLYNMDRELSRLTPACSLSFSKILYENGGDLIESAGVVAQAYEKDCSLTDGYSNLAWILFVRKGEIQLALVYMQKDYQLSRMSPYSKLRFARLLYKDGQKEVACNLVFDAYKDSPRLEDGYSDLVSKEPPTVEIEFILKDLYEGRLSQKKVMRFANLLMELCYFDRERWAELIQTHDLEELLRGKCLESSDVELSRVVAALIGEDYRLVHFVIARCWLQKGCDEQFANLFVLASALAGRDQDAKAAFSILGGRQLQQGDLGKALAWYQKSFKYNYYYHFQSKFEVDYSYIAPIRDYALKLNGNLAKVEDTTFFGSTRKNRTKLLVLLNTIESTAVSRIMKLFIDTCTDTRFDVFYSVSFPIKEEYLSESEIYKLLQHLGLRTVGSFAFSKDMNSALHDTYREIALIAPDVIVTASQSPYDIFMCQAAPGAKIVNMVLGDPACFTLPDADLCIYLSPLAGTSILNPKRLIKLDVANAAEKVELSGAVTRLDINVGNEVTLMVSAGRPHKYQSEDYWRAIARCMQFIDRLHFLLIGIGEDHAVCRRIRQIFSEMGVLNRIQFMDRCANYMEYMALADIYIDSFPEGGGFTIRDAIKLRLPIVSFCSAEGGLAYCDTSPLRHILDPSTFLSVEDEEAFYERITLLINDNEFRQKLIDLNHSSHVRYSYIEGESKVTPVNRLTSIIKEQLYF